MKFFIALTLIVLAFAQHDHPLCDEGLPAIQTGFTEDFQNYLDNNGLKNYSFNRPDLTGGAFGGKASPNDTIINKPVILVHGNSDIAVGNGGSVGW